jgi:hypothetical protein
VNNAPVMGCGEPVGDLECVIGYFALRKRGGGHLIAERLAIKKLGDEVVNAVLLSDIVNGEEIGMAQRAEHAGFLLEALQAVGIAGERFRKNFDGDGAVQARVARTVDLAHAARAERGDNFVGA